MTYDEIHPSLRRWLGGYEALRKLGYRPDEISIAIGKEPPAPGRMVCFVRLLEGEREFLMNAGPIDMDTILFSGEFTRVAEAVNSGAVSQIVLDRIWHESEPYRNTVGFVAALMAKGFNPQARRVS